MDELDTFDGELKVLRQRLDTACEDNDFAEFGLIKDLALAFRRQLESSQTMGSFKDNIAKTSLASKDGIILIGRDPDDILFTEQFVKAKEALAHEMEAKYDEQLQKELDDFRAQMSRDYQGKIDKLEDKIQQKDILKSHEHKIQQQLGKIQHLDFERKALEKQIEELKEGKIFEIVGLSTISLLCLQSLSLG